MGVNKALVLITETDNLLDCLMLQHPYAHQLVETTPLVALKSFNGRTELPCHNFAVTGLSFKLLKEENLVSCFELSLVSPDLF